MPPRPSPSRVAAALDYLQRLKSGVGEFVGGVGSNLADRARTVGGLAYEALTTDPNIGRMTTAEFSQAAADRAPTPRLDQAARDIGTIGRAIVTQPVKTSKAIVGGEIDRFKGAFASPQALGDYAGSLIDPTRLAAALRHRVPISELDVYHGTPHTYAPTEANPLGEFDASKIGTGEGAQAYGHGIYYAENPDVAKGYADTLGGGRFEYAGEAITGDSPKRRAVELLWSHSGEKAGAIDDALNAGYDNGREIAREIKNLDFTKIKKGGSLYKADLPDEMIDRMLDWDKPFAKQPETVKKALRNSGLYKEYRANLSNFASPMGTRNPNMRGENFAAYLEHKLGGQQQVSEYLRSLGIPGIKYLDAGSRGQGGSGTRNFVVFPGEEKKVKILERNGQPAPERIAQALEAAPAQFPMPEKTPRGAKLTMMSPQDYLRQVNEAQGIDFQSAPLPIRKPNTIRDLTKAIKAGEPIETPSLTMQKGKIVDQEGRHRAVAAIQAGVQQIPVFVFERK